VLTSNEARKGSTYQHVDTEELLSPQDEEGRAKTASELQLRVVPEKEPEVELVGRIVLLLQRSHDFCSHQLDVLVFDRKCVETRERLVTLGVTATGVIPTRSIR